ncbi:peptidase inhibitor family I36 protein [Streptomyces sp. NPDC057307]|uniref:peptidase inhibitor family I36 protein n=1 Tax=Streptomyces sp. NPDC057307 TaxID=3346096 RepID=UPI00364266D1
MTWNPQRTHRSTGVGRLAVALMLALAACVTTVGAANADTRPDRQAPTERLDLTNRQKLPSRADFAAQARGAGLTGSEAKALQAEANAHLAKWGGTQTAANRIQLPGGELTLVLPGEKYARDLNAKGGARTAAASCPYTYVCAYPGRDFTGTELRLFTCDYQARIYWSGTGSWINNQRSALRAKFYDSGRVLRWTSPGGYSEDRAADWTWVWYLSPC